jgi:hypothetical protein
MRTIDLHTPSFGSSHDPVLYGVANGLSDLFPPVDHPVSFGGEPHESQDAADPALEPAITSDLDP